ncbi:MAG: flagellar biosynthesis anti-sigma factor FlgM [Rhodocyclaceae bacterium]|nr:flagellar biosynthesis anti-sigma factor FlgM [Rhodocyclaceae bacterium]MCO5097964.1 flagellar biosynthesis anti-sigma factor FlgM [Rhodocyclaceae bacterium]MCZ7653519.1 flagellar biosynthesis anti-sigma factor FlgM [Rhodocyclaceae bacterium]
MKIDNSVGSVGGVSSGESRQRPGKSSTPATDVPSEKVELSSLAARMQEVEAALANVPVADSGRIAEIKQAMAEGRFQVDASKVADGLIESVKQMIASQARRA